MAGATIRMTANKENSLQEIHRRLYGIDGSEEISKIVQKINDVEIWTLVYEKYYFRVGSYVGATVVLTEHNQMQTACVVASSGGNGMENISLGANRNYAKACVQVLESCGFSIAESDLDTQGKGVIDRFFK